jgi:hypothetical protein
LRLTRSPAEYATRSCSCSFCRAHATRTTSDPNGQVEIQADDWSLVERYRFGTATAEFLLCRTCGVYIGAVCETPHGLRAVTNVNCLTDRAAFPPASSFPDHDEEPVEARLARRAANWTPAVVLGA